MSGTQKNSAGGGQPMQQRGYQLPTYQPSHPSSLPQLPAGYVSQQPPNQAGNQGPLRGIPQPGPPNQASTPPNTDLKVQAVQHPNSINSMYQAQNSVPVRPTQQLYRPQGPGPTRMTNQQHRGQQQPIFQTPQQTFVPIQQVFMPGVQGMHAYFPMTAQARQNIMPAHMYHHQVQGYPSYSTAQAPTSAGVPYPYPYQTTIQGARPQPQPQPTSQPSNQTPAALPTMQMPQTTQPPPPQPYISHTRQPKTRKFAIPIINPATGSEVDTVEDSSHPPSGESSARQTPQPNMPISKDVQAAFAKQVAQAIISETMPPASLTEVEYEHPGVLEQAHYHHPHQQPPVPVYNDKLDQIVQSKNLNVQAKEFILPQTAKEPPIVSANCDAVEVTLPNKQQKDRESPAKSRKQHRVGETNKDSTSSTKDSPVAAIDKPHASIVTSVGKEEVKKDTPPAHIVTIAPPAASQQPALVKDDKKGHKKEDIKDVKAPEFLAPQSVQSEHDHAKSKQNASQRTKEAQKPAPSVNQKAAIVPPPQPTKVINKTSKKNELNVKGANKEGTDMDAFNDNVISSDAVNANVDVNTNNDIINANSVIPPSSTNVTPTPPPTSTVVPDSNNIKIESNETATITPDVKTKPKPKVDVTDIFNVSQAAKPFVPPAAVAPQRDEVDRAALSNEKLVRAKNEANAKASPDVHEANNVDAKVELPYKTGQWAPDNKDGKKVYDRDFLFAIRDLPTCKVKPDNLLPSIAWDERPRLPDQRYSMGSRTDFTNIPFPNYGGKSASQRGPLVNKRNSQSGKINVGKGKSNNGGGGGGGNKIVSISLREEIKLHESENAWKPARLNPKGTVTEDDIKTEDLYKKVRGVLNKLTPQKFGTLVNQVRCLQIDTEARLQGVIDLVFEKAVDEPSFSVAYANMCKELAIMQVPTDRSTEEKRDYVNFRKLLITRCQQEFERQSKDESCRNDKLEEIEKCTDPEKKKELEIELEEYDRRIRMRSVGNIRFIGELFKIDQLTAKIMVRCLDNLLKNKDEERLECLCKLLSTIGKELESKKGTDLTPYINIMQEIVDLKHGQITNRIKFMLQDVMDLRRHKWIPRRNDINPKTMDQIQKEAESEQLNIQVMNSVPSTPRKDDRGGSLNKNKRNNTSDDGWTVTQRNTRTQQFSVQSDKLKSKAPLIDEPFGSSQMFGSWIRGSNIKNTPTLGTSSLTNTTNKYAALDIVDMDRKSMPLGGAGAPRGGKDPYSSKGSSLERSTFKPNYDGPSSRSSSQQRSHDGSNSSSQRSTPAPSTYNLNKAPAATPAPPAALVKMSEDELERFAKNRLEEYINDNCTFEECDAEIRRVIPPPYMKRMVADGFLHVLEKFKAARIKTGSLFAKLMKEGTLPLEEYCIGLEEVLSQADDLRIDIPKIWDYLAEVLVEVLCEEALPLSRLHKSFEVLISQNQATELLVPLFKLVIVMKSPDFLKNYWQLSGLKLSDFMTEDSVEGFIKNNNFEFLSGGDTPVGQSELSYEQISKKLLEFLALDTTLDEICGWINANVGERVKEKKFVRTLATAIFSHSIHRAKLVPDTLQKWYNLLHKYVDTDEKLELECLYALQALVHKMEHPQGLLYAICDLLSDDGVFSQESFVAWQTSSDPKESEGKGVALKQLTSFFTRLMENDDEDYGSSASDEA